jgi:hypothetical protein
VAAKKKKELHPALRENADKLKRGEPLHSGGKKRPNSRSATSTKKGRR